MPQHQMESNPPVAESNRDSNTRRAARHGRLLELDEDSETSTCALQERRSTSELIQQINGTNVVPTPYYCYTRAFPSHQLWNREWGWRLV